MKNKKLMGVLIGLGATASLVTPMTALTSCNEKNEEEEEEELGDQQILINTDWTLNFVFKKGETIKNKAFYCFDLQNFVGGEVVKLNIDSAKDASGNPVDFITIVSGEQTKVKEGDEYIEFEASINDEEKYDTPQRYTFTLSATISLGSDQKNQVIGNYILDVANPTTEEDFEISAESQQNRIVQGFKGEDYKQKNLFLLPNNVHKIANNAFYDTETSTTKIPLGMQYLILYQAGQDGPTLNSIGNNAFNKANFIGDCYIPSSVETIGQSAFAAATFNKFYVGLGGECQLKTIGANAFHGCSKLKGKCVIPEGVEVIGNGAFWSTGFNDDIVLPKSLKTIEDSAFRYIRSNRSHNVIIPKEGSQLEYIGSGAFMQNNFSGALYIPDSCGRMGHQAFQLAQYVEEISLPAHIQFWKVSEFDSVKNLGRLDLSRVTDYSDSIFEYNGAQFFNGAGSVPGSVTIVLNKSLQSRVVDIKQTFVNEGMVDNIYFEFVD